MTQPSKLSLAKRATALHIRACIQHALWEDCNIATKDDIWYSEASVMSQRWHNKVRSTSVLFRAREHLKYWRLRAFMNIKPDLTGWPGDRHDYIQWMSLKD